MKVLKFYSDNCVPCKVLAPFINEIKEMDEFKNISFEEININNEENYELIEKFKIQAVPTLVLLNDDDTLNKKMIGLIPKQDLIEFLKNEMS